jgi:hypothetical protein
MMGDVKGLVLCSDNPAALGKRSSVNRLEKMADLESTVVGELGVVPEADSVAASSPETAGYDDDVG